MASEHFSLSWDNFHKNMSSGMNSLLENEDLVDVTLAVEGKYLKAHKMVLSVCSPYFRELFRVNPCKHPIVFMKDVTFMAMSDLLQFMYQGEVQVSQENLKTFLNTAEALQVKGLTGDGNGSNDNDVESDDRVESPKIVDIEEVKSRQPKEFRASGSSTMPPTKRQRLSTASADSIKMPFISKSEPVSTAVSNNDQLLQFKMEPLDQNQTVTIPDIDDSMDDANVDDNEDYSILEGGDEEPQAGTSTDGATEEGQDCLDSKIKRKPNMPRYIVDGFVFHVNITKGKPPMLYLRCLEYKRLGCHARAIIPSNGSIKDIKVNKPHNHPPDFAAEEKIIFMRELREVMLSKPDNSARNVYDAISGKYPNAARETHFNSIRHKMNRWRKQ